MTSKENRVNTQRDERWMTAIEYGALGLWGALILALALRGPQTRVALGQVFVALGPQPVPIAALLAFGAAGVAEGALRLIGGGGTPATAFLYWTGSFGWFLMLQVLLSAPDEFVDQSPRTMAAAVALSLVPLLWNMVRVARSVFPLRNRKGARPER